MVLKACLLFSFITIAHIVVANDDTQDITQNGVRYKVLFELSDYQQVESWCKELGGHLPSLHSQSDIDFMYKLMPRDSRQGYIFLGARPEGNGWKWDDGTAMDFSLNRTIEHCGIYEDLNDCALVIVAKVGYPWDKTIVNSDRRYAMTGVRICRLAQ